MKFLYLASKMLCSMNKKLAKKVVVAIRLIRISPVILILMICFSAGAQTLAPSRATRWSDCLINEAPADYSLHYNFGVWGGVGDGITANDTVFANILADMSGDSAVIEFPAGNYLFRYPLVLPSHLILKGHSADSTSLMFDPLSATDLIQIRGSRTAIESPLISDVAKDSNCITPANASLFSAGDYVLLTEKDSMLVTSAWALNTTGQILRIDSISGGKIVLESPLRREFYCARNARIIKLNMKEGVVIENLKIVRMDTTTTQTSNISFEYAAHCKLKCVESLYCNFAHVDAGFSTNLMIEGCFIHEAYGYGDGGKGYGVMLEAASGQCFVTRCIFNHLRHSMILQAGANGNVFAYNYSMNPYWTDVTLPSNSAGDAVLHGNYPYCNLFEGNTVQNIVIDDSHGANGKYNTFFRNRAELYGIFMNTTVPTNDQNFIGNEITNTGFLLGNYFLSGSGHFQYGNNVKGTITPAGTGSLAEASLLYQSAPLYYFNASAWPPIGPPNALNAHHIEMQDRYNAGAFTVCSEIVTVDRTDTPLSEDVFSAYPNPCSDRLYVNIPGVFTEQPVNVELWDVNGRLVLKKDFRGVLDVSSLNEGLYFLRLSGSRAGEGKVVVIQR
jgi:hypothetical protein